ncbi:MAG: CBS domain-containing protein [Alphaproteobacteria bacterium]
MNISEIMSPEVDLADPNMSLHAAAIKMRDDHVGSLPVGENDRLIGMITDRDIAVRGVAGHEHPENTAVRSCMSEHVFYCFDDQPLAEAGKMMAEHQVHRLPVLNRDKRLVGIVALADLARAGEEGAQAAGTALAGICEPTREPRR